MVAACSSETLLLTYSTTWCDNLEGHGIHLHHHGDFKLYTLYNIVKGSDCGV
jgi:hypothetical protein